MDVEKNLLISIIKLTKNGPISDKLVKSDAKILTEVAVKLLRKLQNDGLVYLRNDLVEVDAHQRLRLAVRAIELGADVESVSGFLQWKEFEDIAAVALERNRYSVTRNLRFRHAGRRWEIDVVGCKKPVALCVDCKHWHRSMYPSVLKKIVEEQVERTFALANSIPNPSYKRIEFASWNKIELVPAVLSLVAGRLKFYDDVPIIPVLQLQDFLNQLPAYVDSLKHITKNLSNHLNSV